MRLIGHLQGFAGFREAIEEYQPERGVVQKELIDLVRSKYEFQTFPNTTPGTGPLPIITFVGGKFASNGDSFAITQLAMTQEGDVVVAVTTEQAALVLDDLVKLLDDNLGFRLKTAHKIKRYLSNIVVEFDQGLEECIAQLSEIGNAINRLRPGLQAFSIKRLAFGAEAVTQTNDPLAAIEMADFLIERRQGSRYEANRYFCSAPMTTRDHLRALEEIEAIARSRGR
jgi:hypothetical protein